MTCQTLGLVESGFGSIPGSDYTGDVQISKSGKLCERWDNVVGRGNYWWGYDWGLPHNDEYKKWKHNKCRNPDNKPGGAWCWLVESDDYEPWFGDRPWEYCSQIPGIHFVLNREVKLG